MQTEAHIAYAKGRNSVWNEMGPECPFTDAEGKKWFKLGRQSAKAELKLDADTEWD